MAVLAVFFCTDFKFAVELSCVIFIIVLKINLDNFLCELSGDIWKPTRTEQLCTSRNVSGLR